MDDSFGARLRAQRERQGVTLTTIAEQTKIRLSQLEGLERDDPSHWPSGIFRRSFMRSYAIAIGLDPDPVVREFLDRYPDPVEVAQTEMGAVLSGSDAGTASSSKRPPTRLGCLMASGAAAIGRMFQGEVKPEPQPLRMFAAPSSLPAVDIPAPDPLLLDPPSTELRLDFALNDCGTAVEAPEPSPTTRLFSGLERVLKPTDITPLLERAATMLDAIGLVVWSWEPRALSLTPSFAYGYSDAALARFPRVRRDNDNAVAVAFRSAETSIVESSGTATGAVVVPLMAPRGCVGVLALELPSGGEQRESVVEVATMLAAQLAGLVGAVTLAEAVNA